MERLLKAINENWDLTTSESWHYTVFELSPEGDLRIRVYYLHPVVDTTVIISADDLDAIKTDLDKINLNPPDTFPEACDGEAWAFKVYDTGKEIFKWKLSHIYGIETLENIGRILNSYIPEYEEPKYTKEEIERYLMLFAEEQNRQERGFI